MGPSPTLVHPGLRTPARSAWRSGVAQALATVASSPSLWLLGALGFLVRGGVVVLVLPVLVLPSPVALRMLIGDNLTSTGFTPAFYAIAAAGGALLLGLVLAGLAIASAVEVAAFERLGQPLAPRVRRRAAGKVFVVQLVALGALVGAALPLVAKALVVTYDELVRPSLGGPLYDRVLAQLGGELYLLLAVLVLVEAASAVATRRLLVGAAGDRSTVRSPLTAVLVGLGRPILRPLSTLGTALVGWLVTIALLAPSLWALQAAWAAVRGALLGAPPANGAELGAAVGVIVLCGAWLAALALAGFATALRAALWSTEELR